MFLEFNFEPTYNYQQVKVLNDYFEQNAYPKDEEIEKISKFLNLQPRIIVVWFQNMRQKVYLS